MHGVVLKFASGADVAPVGVQQLGLLVQTAALPFAFARAVEQHDSALGCLGPKGGALTFQTFQFKGFLAVGTGELAVFNYGLAFLLALRWVLAGGTEFIRAATQVTPFADRGGKHGLVAPELAGHQRSVIPAIPAVSG